MTRAVWFRFAWGTLVVAALLALSLCRRPEEPPWDWYRPPGAAAMTTELPPPHGPTGNWKLDWHDEFSVNLANPDPVKWRMATWPVNGVEPTTGNMWVFDNRLVLQLSSIRYGAAIIATRHLNVGEVAEAYIRFPGDDAKNNVFNFPAWWAAGVEYPGDGEIDIAEGLGRLSVSYWDRDKILRAKTFPEGDWNNRYHWYTVQREESRVYVYWDSKLVRSIDTNDGGGPQRLILNVGYNSRFQTVTGRGSRVMVGAVRVFKHA